MHKKSRGEFFFFLISLTGVTVLNGVRGLQVERLVPFRGSVGWGRCTFSPTPVLPTCCGLQLGRESVLLLSGSLVRALVLGRGRSIGSHPGWQVEHLTTEPLVILFFIVSSRHNFLFFTFYKFGNIFAWLIINKSPYT